MSGPIITHRPHYATRRETDAALAHVDRDLTPARAMLPPWWLILAGYVGVAVVVWWLG